MKHHCENHAKCMQMIQAVIDGSATPEEVEHFKTHMHDCMPCIDGYELEKSIKDALQVKVEKKCCPKSTLMTIKEKIGIATLVTAFVFIEIKLYHIFFSC